MAKYKMKDLENGEQWYFDSVAELRKEANKYTDECEGDWMPEYRVFNPSTGKFRLMDEQEIKAAHLPR